MSRIAGFIGRDGAGLDASQNLRSMLNILPGSGERVAEARLAAIGWRGSDRGGAASEHGVLVAIDGVVLDDQVPGGERRPKQQVPETFIGRYRRHGFRDMVAGLHGDFAIALYDTAVHTLWLARDRFGVKPLYYTLIGDGVAFASQPRALLTCPGVSHDVNTGFVARFAGSHYRTFDNRPEESPFAAIAQLPASCVIAFTGENLGSPSRYWQLAECCDWDETEDSLAEQYRERLLRAVSRRLQVAGKPAFTLSGGLDSSSILCCAERVAGARPHAFSSTYADATYDERDEIADVVSAKVSEWTPVEIPDAVDVIGIVERMVRIHDEPVATATWLSHLLICEAVAERGFDSLFGGLGGDELNAGEYEYFPFFFADLQAQAPDGVLEREIASWMRHHDHPIYRKNVDTARAMLGRLIDPVSPGRCLPDRERLARYANAVDRDYARVADFEPVMEAPFRSYLKNRAYQDLFRETLPCCLRAEDRQCTASGIAHFDPFLDHELVEFMFKVPGTMKIREGVTKYLLRLAMRAILPEPTRLRVKKTGWNAPAHKWFTGTTLDALRDVVRSSRFRERGIYDVGVVERIIDEHERIVADGAPRENHMMFLWQLLNLHLWLSAVEEQAATGVPSVRASSATP